MSDLDVLRYVGRIDNHAQQMLVVERPGVRLPFAPRATNPIALGASGAILGDFPWAARSLTVLAINLCVVVTATNNGTNYWTIQICDTYNATTYASVTTAALTPGVWGVLAPASLPAIAATEVVLSVRAVATNTPGSIYIVPELIVG